MIEESNNALMPPQTASSAKISSGLGVHLTAKNLQKIARNYLAFADVWGLMVAI